VRSSDPNAAEIIVSSSVNDSDQTISFEAGVDRLPDIISGAKLTFAIGDRPFLQIPALRPAGLILRASLSIEELRQLDRFDITIRDDSGTEVSDGLEHMFTGAFFDAVSIDTPQDFFAKVQLNHSRFSSPVVLEIAARAAFARFAGNYCVEAAALTIVAHRFLERPVASLKGQDQHINWLLDRSAALLERGEARLNGVKTPDWEVARWTISLATVAGYLALIGDRYVRAEGFFAIPVRYVDLVRLARVSALNIVTGCFVHGLLSHIQGRNDAATASFTTGVQSLPALVAAQDLMENVWVIGDLMNVMRAARQCYIALVRLKLIPATGTGGAALMDANTQILVSDVTGPLHAILLAGRSPLMARAVAASGGNI
jgi:hypothetical protein